MKNEREWLAAERRLNKLKAELISSSIKGLLADATVGIIGAGTMALGYTGLADHEQALLYSGAAITGLSLADGMYRASNFRVKSKSIEIIEKKVELRKTIQRTNRKEE